MTTYCLDSSVLINGWRKHYLPNLAPKFWTFISDMIASGQAIVPREVYEELQEQDDDLLGWLKQRRQFVRDPTEDVVLALKAIMQHLDYGRIVKYKSRGGRSGADPWLIAHAQVWGARVVCEEGKGGNDPKVPDVCLKLGVKCIKTTEMLVAENFTF